MKPYTHPRLATLFFIAEFLESAAREMAMEARKRSDARKPKSGRGATLRPSLETPLWNALVTMVQPNLKKRGQRALLARELGLHRARIGEYFGRKSAMPDAERTLELLIWLGRQAAKPTS
jgi:hypothetical protein